MTAKDWFSDFARGSSLGLGMIPGVSVGTIGLIVNVYDKLLDSISGLTKHFFKAAMALLPLALGCVISALIILIGYSYLSEYIPFEITALFGGLTLGGTPVIIKAIDWKNLRKSDVLRILIGFIVAAGIGVLSVLAYKFQWFDVAAAFENPNENIWVYPVTFVAGFIAAVACLLPGISGSMVLFIFGIYNPIIALYSGDNSMLHNHDRIGTGLLLTLILLVGVIMGLVCFAKVMRKLEENHRQATFTIVLGFIIGSVASIFVNNNIWSYYESGAAWWHYLIGAFLFVAGFFALYLAIRWSWKRAEQNASQIQMEEKPSEEENA